MHRAAASAFLAREAMAQKIKELLYSLSFYFYFMILINIIILYFFFFITSAAFGQSLMFSKEMINV